MFLDRGPLDRTPEAYRAEAERVRCSRYRPCPIDGRCQVKASHLYHKCDECRVPFDNHNEKQRAMIIRRENFAITPRQLSVEALDSFRELTEPAGALTQCLFYSK